MSELWNSLTCTLHFSTVDIIEGMKKMRRVKCELSREVQKWEKISKILHWSETSCVFMDFWSSWSVLSPKFSKSAPSRFLWHLEDTKSTPLPFLYSSVSRTTCHLNPTHLKDVHGFMLRTETFPVCKLCLWGACRWWEPRCRQKPCCSVWCVWCLASSFFTSPYFISLSHLHLHLPFLSSLGFYITLHLPFSLSARDCFPERLPSMLRLMFLFLSRFSSSWKSSVTLWLVLADVSMKAHFHWLAWASPSLVSTSRWVSSLLFPTSMIGIASTLPFIARTCKGKQMDLICYFLGILLVVLAPKENTSLQMKAFVV